VDPKKPPSNPLADTDPAVADTAHSEPGTAPDHVAAAAATAAAAKGPRQVRSGDTLGRYELVEEIGEGGMATVFRANDKQLRREVAVKVLFPHLARRHEVVRRFHREARAAAGLEHANILRIYDVGGGENDDPPYIVMELIRGRTLLEEVEQRGSVLAEVVACIGALLADALAAAHAKGIIHRDIKPSNVLIAHGGRLLLADFGVARLETEDSSLVTRTGALLGTPAYMSPEQASGDTATAKSDLYSLGATLYQLSTSLLPYSGSPAKVMSQIATGALVAPVRRRAEVGPDLSRAIEKLMENDPAARPANATTVANELRALAQAGGLGDPTEELAAYFADPAAFLADRTPRVVSAIVSAGKQALAESKLPRAMALADRASALAPEDPAVKTLVETVTEGGRASRRRKVVLAGLAGAVVIGGATLGVMQLAGGGPGGSDAAVVAIADAAPADAAAMVIDAAPLVSDAAPLVSDAEPGPDDAAIVVAPADARPIAVRDAAIARTLDAGVRDAAIAMSADATVIDAAPLAGDAAPPGDAAPAVVADATLVIKNDTWCDIAVDGTAHGRLTGAAARIVVKVTPGPHTITCVQPGLLSWTYTVTVEAGKTVAYTGNLLAAVDVTIAIAGDRVQIDGTSYPRGARIKLKPGRRQGQVFRGDQAGIGGFFDVPRVACRLREVGTGLACDP
jgi:serine/threonine-protein kinase